MSNATAGFGTLLKKSSTTIAEVKSISGPGLSLDVQDVTSLSSTNGWKEFLPTLLECGEITLNINFLPADSTQGASSGLIKDMVDRTASTYSIVFSDSGSTTWSFSAYVTKFQPSAAVGGVLSATVTLRPTGKPTLA